MKHTKCTPFYVIVLILLAHTDSTHALWMTLLCPKEAVSLPCLSSMVVPINLDLAHRWALINSAKWSPSFTAYIHCYFKVTNWFLWVLFVCLFLPWLWIIFNISHEKIRANSIWLALLLDIIHIVLPIYSAFHTDKGKKSSLKWKETVSLLVSCKLILFIIIIYLLAVRVVGAPQMIFQPCSSFFPCSSLPSGTWQTPGLFIPWCCPPTSSSVCLVFFPLSLCLARWFWPDLMNGRHDHTTAVCIFLRWSGGLRGVWLPARSWHRLPCWQHGLWDA